MWERVSGICEWAGDRKRARTEGECESSEREKRGLIKLLCQLNFIFILIVLIVRLLFVSEWVKRKSERASKQAGKRMDEQNKKKRAHTHCQLGRVNARDKSRVWVESEAGNNECAAAAASVCVCVCEYCFCLMFLYFAHNWSSNTTACFFFVSLCVCVRAYFRIVKLFLPFTSKKMKSERENKKISNTNNTTPPPPPPPSSSSSPSTANAQYIPVFILYYLCVSGRANEWKYAYAFEPNAGKFITLSTQRAQEGESERKGILYFRA